MVQSQDIEKPTTGLNDANSQTTFTTSREDVPLKLNESFSERRRIERLRIFAITLCVVSVIVNFVSCIIAFVFASLKRSPATFAFGVDCVLDLLSSLIVIWRYFGSPYTTSSHSRENKACISLGGLFTLAGVGVIAQGVYFLCSSDTPKWFTVLIILAAVGFTTYLLLGIAKIVLSKKMKSKSLFLDALNSLLSALFAMTIIVGDIAYWINESVWYLDPLLSIVLSFGLLAFGLHTIYVHSRSNDRPGN